MKLKLCDSGIHLLTDNGYTLSIKIGYFNYCKNYLEPSYDNVSRGCAGRKGAEIHSSPDAEIAVWHTGTGAWLRLNEYDDVLGYVPISTCFDLATVLESFGVKEFFSYLNEWKEKRQ